MIFLINYDFQGQVTRPSDQASQVSGYRRSPFCRARRVVSSSLCAWEQLPKRSVSRRSAWCPGAKPLLAANNLGVGLVGHATGGCKIQTLGW